MTKHTPGPWKVDLGEDGAFWVEAVVEDATKFLICSRLKVSKYGHVDESESNAYLIAAAPDLLAALEDLLPWLEDCRAACGARAAIAKARGEG